MRRIYTNITLREGSFSSSEQKELQTHLDKVAEKQLNGYEVKIYVSVHSGGFIIVWNGPLFYHPYVMFILVSALNDYGFYKKNQDYYKISSKTICRKF